ncbi:hypothetical protein Tco_0924645 [Tanacetum coccineum]|uniref:Uncharacterized protein n=1 Tax=Tanacetum coccineum TaxID=301880 RepID=A0ABQ5D4F6_9ASTR
MSGSPQTQVDEDVEIPINEEQPATISAPSTSEPQDQLSTPHDSLNKNLLTHHPMIYLSLRKVDTLEKDKLAQATEILSLKKRVEKLKKRRKLKPFVLRRLRKIGSATRVESSRNLIDADQELAARMTLEEHENYTVEEKARILAKFIKNRKK